MPEYRGTVDGQPAKIMYYPDRKQSVIYWGGAGAPDGPGHNHMVVNDAEKRDRAGRVVAPGPVSIHWMRENGRVVVDHGYNPDSRRKKRNKAQRDVGAMLVDAFRNAWEFNMRNLRGGR
jgi:hypothetical protein